MNAKDVNLSELVAELRKLNVGKDPLMSPVFNNLVDAGLHHTHLPDSLKGKAAESLQTVFEAMGGMPRMLLWADEHPAAFYKLFARMVIPTISPVLPAPQEQSIQAPAWLTAQRLAYQQSHHAQAGQHAATDGEDDGDGMEGSENDGEGQ